MTGPTRHELEVLSDRSMPGSHRFRIGDWVLRAGHGATGRANSTWPTGDPGCALNIAVTAAEDWYSARGLRAGFQIYEGADHSLTAELDRRDYDHMPGALVMWARIADLELGADRLEHQWHVVESERPNVEFAKLMKSPDRVKEISTSTLKHRFVAVFNNSGELLGGGKSALDGDALGIFAMETAPEARRRGVAKVVMSQLIQAGLSEGADAVWLQVMESNTVARPLYERAGFVPFHNYEYRFCS